MAVMTIAENKRNFLLDGKPCFYLADTAWSVFPNTSEADWEKYIYYRKKQGFNAVQFNILPQWDRSHSLLDIHPFAQNSDGTYDYDSINEEYFNRAARLLAVMQKLEMVPVLTLLWCNYIDGTWATPIADQGIMTLAQAEQYARYAIAAFAPYTPVYFVSGDTDFSDISNPYYEMGLELVKELSPRSITALHISGDTQDIPDSFMNSPLLDFYTYQSGHNATKQANAYIQAKQFYDKPVIKPIFNSEPAYEQMGIQNIYGRWQRKDVRRVMWQSLLSGGSAGITYGAYGIWDWRDSREKYDYLPDERTGGGFDLSFDWTDALRFEGAWDYSFAKHYFESHNLYNLIPVSEELEYQNVLAFYGVETNGAEEIRIAKTEDGERIFIYLPHNTALKVKADWSGYDFRLLDLATGHRGKIAWKCEDGVTRFELNRSLEDVLLIGVKA